VADRLIVDLGADGRVAVSSWPEGEQLPSPAGEPFELAWPLDGDAMEDLRWYLEDYLRAPYGVYEERGPEVAAALTGWGQAVFGSVFGSGPGRDAYVQARARAGVDTEIVFRSSAAAALGLPWELLHDPSHPTPVALDMVDVTRSIPTADLGQAFAVTGEQLRVLMVISRPAAGEDVGYRMIARPLLEQLEAVRGRVELVVLRPPTLDALGRVLAGALAEERPFQVVHFDGHGVLAGRRPAAGALGGAVTLEGSGAEGVLVFEKPEGGPDERSAEEVAQVLRSGQVPLVVLNACQSGAVGKELEAALATRLLQEGVGSAVAMAYTVYAVAAAEFMAAFYERLFAGDGVTAAVSAGRRHLHLHNDRPSPKGEMPLEDWVVPVHYMRREVHFPDLKTEPGDRGSRGGQEQAGAGVGLLEPVESFVGRDALFYELEVATRLQRVVVLHGPGGTGKTELAKAFGRWWRDTGGVERPEWVIVHSFEPGVASFGLEGVTAEIGLAVFGPDFARLDPSERLAQVERVLKERRLLLIWDNFETVFTMPDPTGATPALEEAGRNELRAFLQRLAAGGRSAVVLTSRTEEPWLGELRRIEVGGLAPYEAIEYANQILAPYPTATPRRAKRAFAELLEWLDGHPLSMRLVLPHLQATAPEALLGALQGAEALPGAIGEDGGRTASLGACVNYSFEHLSQTTRSLLIAVCLFHGVADVDVLGLLSQVTDAPPRFAGLSKESWSAAMEEAAGVGLLSVLGGGMYRIHPALPTYLAARWRSEEPDGHDHQREAATGALLAAYAAFGAWLVRQIETGEAGFAFALIDRQRRTLGHLLGFALDSGRWEEAQMIAQPLNSYFDGRGRYEEARGWVDRARLALEGPGGAPPDLDDPAGALWLFFVGSEATRQLASYRLESAERTYRDILAILEAQSPSEQQRKRLAVAYHQLGMVAEERGLYDKAEEWYRKSLRIEEALGNRSGMAYSYHQLGMVTQERGQLDDAEAWYRKSLALKEELGNRPGIATSYHQLGMIAEERGQPDDAEGWYLKSLALKEALGNRSSMASDYHQLGVVAQKRGHLESAEARYLESLAIQEALGNRPGMASSYHQLGMIAHQRGRLDDAEDWYRKSLAIEEALDSRPTMARTCGQLSLLSEDRSQDQEALEWVVRCVSLFDEFPHPATAHGPKNLARLTSKLGIGALEASWREVAGAELPRAIRDYVQPLPPT
jgi:tetratricopeptide (TPR) repeat protein